MLSNAAVFMWDWYADHSMSPFDVLLVPTLKQDNQLDYIEKVLARFTSCSKGMKVDIIGETISCQS